MSWSVGERLKRIIDVVFGGSINAAATAIHVDTSTLFRLIEGSVSDPRMDTVRRLAEEFGVPAMWLVGELDAAGAQTLHDPLPEWVWLLDAYARKREQKLRDWLSEADASNPDAKRLIGDLKRFRLFPTAQRSPFAILSHLMTPGDEGIDEEIQALRHLYQLQLEMLELGIIKAWKLGAEPRPPRPTTSESSRRTRKLAR